MKRSMKKLKSLSWLWSLALIAFPLDAMASDERQAVAISFALIMDERAVGCDGTTGPLGRGAVTAKLLDARFYLQEVAVLDAAGNATPVRLTINNWQNEQVALLDFGEGASHCNRSARDTNEQVIGTVPRGQYVGLSFTIGVPKALNHTSTELEAPPLDLAAMGWSWQAGRKFIRIEMDPEGGITKGDGSRAQTWFVHVGSTGCTGHPAKGSVSCLYPNRLPIVVERFDTQHQVVTLNLASLFRTSALSEDREGASGCMSNLNDPECAPIFERLGLSLATGLPLAAGSSPLIGVRSKH